MPNPVIGDKFGEFKFYRNQDDLTNICTADLIVKGWRLNSTDKTIVYTLEFQVTVPNEESSDAS